MAKHKVTLSCGHEQNTDKDPGEYLGCLSCPQSKANRSGLSRQTRAPQRKIMSLVNAPKERPLINYTIGG